MPHSILPQWIRSIFLKLSRGALLACLEQVYVRQHETLPDAEGGPVILYANHVCCWDGHLALQLTESLLKRSTHIMTADKTMKRYPFLTWVGCFSVEKDNPFAVRRSLNHAVSILKHEPNCGLWIFPQGEYDWNNLRPLGFHSGLAHIIRQVPHATVVPVAFQYEMLRSPRQRAFVSMGAARIMENAGNIHRRFLTEKLELALTEELDQLEKDLLAGRSESFQTFLTFRNQPANWPVPRRSTPAKKLAKVEGF